MSGWLDIGVQGVWYESGGGGGEILAVVIWLFITASIIYVEVFWDIGMDLRYTC